MRWAAEPGIVGRHKPAALFQMIPLRLRYMRLDDIQAVAAIDRLSFQPPWNHESYRFELNESQVSHMVVLEKLALPSPAARAGWLEQLRGRLPGAAAGSARGGILGYGCIWNIADEAHISTIATHPTQRGKGYGEILLASMVGKALQLGAGYIVLEVRVSNQVAQNLYAKYGFSRYGRRRRYYASNNEDAWDMRLTLDRAARRRFAQLHERLQAKHELADAFSRARHPRGIGDSKASKPALPFAAYKYLRK